MVAFTTDPDGVGGETMRQHMLNGGLVAAMVALVFLLGITAYAEVKEERPRTTCLHDNAGVKQPAAPCAKCAPAACEDGAPGA
ncbi:hypothetical protein [Mesorhizobium sp. BH1-1-4]|uniref:hypothetical protein n=1 Tax=Mesorhizobium sp. BH1-1-4 TaxID=2876662 RepID=UPI001CD1750A|nr:hypothetical protein [Mesorhizobium sp. BH1-1-4]MBZ9997384.1 hypothetical protein [Mesorhizobium sp. BH1-1-4]